MLLLDHAGGIDHRGQGHRDVLCLGGEQLVNHGVPGGAAGGCHIGLLGGNLFHKVPGLLHGADVGAHSHLNEIPEAKLLNGRAELGNGYFLAKLPGKGGGGNGIDLVSLHNGANHLIDLALVHNGAKGAGNQALAAGYTFVLVDDGLAVLIGADGIHAAGGLAGPLHVDDGIVIAGLGAFAAPDALAGIDLALAVNEADGIPGTDLLAGGSQAVLAVLRHPILIGGAGMAGIGNNVDQRRLIIALGNGRLIHTLGHQASGLNGADGQAHGKPHPLTCNGSLQKYGFPMQGLIPGHDDVGQILCLGVVGTGIGHAGDLGKYLFTDVGDQGRDSSHICSSIMGQNAFFCPFFSSIL